MKFDLKTLLIVIFAWACLWLSFELKSNRQELADVAAELEQTNSKNRLLSYHFEIMQEAIGLNFGLNPIPVLKPELSGHSDAGPLAVLYLRAHACSPCHIPVIRRIIDNAWQNPHFRIVSHESNRHFLLQELDEDAFAQPGKVTLISGKLFEKDNLHYDAKLLLIDGQRRITALLPLEMLREEDLFAELKEKKFFGLH